MTWLRPSGRDEAAEMLADRGSSAELVSTGAPSPGQQARRVLEDTEVAVLSTAGLPPEVEHEPMDLTVTASAGLRVAELQERLASGGQWLPVGCAGSRQSVGGLVAAALPGRWDEAYGPVGRQLLALEAVNREGTVHRWGRRVVKNVAGYDVPRLFCGSFGRLGVVLRATFRVWPRPQSGHRLRITPGLRALDAYATLPPGEELGADAAVWSWNREAGTGEREGVLELELRGTTRSVEARRERLRRWSDGLGLSLREGDAAAGTWGGGPDEVARSGDSSPGRASRRLDESVVRLQVENAALPGAASRVRQMCGGAVTAMEALPRPGVLRVRLRPGRGVGGERAAELVEGMLEATPAGSCAVERGPPGLHRAMDGRRDGAVRALEDRVVEAMRGAPRHWLGDYL